MAPTFRKQPKYSCPDCDSDVECAAGPDSIVAWQCTDCDWATTQDTFDPAVPPSLTGEPNP